MIILLLMFSVLFSLGLFLILSDVFHLPKLSVQKAMLCAIRKDKKSTKTIESLLISASIKLSKLIHLDEYKQIHLSKSLDAADIKMTPEVYTAYALVKAGTIALLIIPCLFILPLLCPVIVFLSIMVYFKEIKRADEQLTRRRNKIECELPRFVSTITQELKSGRDVLSMLENYKKSADNSLANELDIVTADMRSSSYESALTRFQSRINSPMLSDIVRGLIGVLRGDDNVVYFQMLSHDMKQFELQRLKAQAMKIPPKIRIFSFIMLLCFLFTYLAVIAFEIVRSMGTMY